AVVIQVTDDGAPTLSVSTTLTVTAHEVNDPPFIAPIEDRSTEDGTLLSFVVAATDAEDNNITFSLGSDAPTGATIDPVNGHFSWTPTNDQSPAVYTITVL